MFDDIEGEINMVLKMIATIDKMYLYLFTSVYYLYLVVIFDLYTFFKVFLGKFPCTNTSPVLVLVLTAVCTRYE